jgi:prepilin-type processing-associated H-X9-DG protein
MNKRKGLSKIEVVVVIVAIAILFLLYKIFIPTLTSIDGHGGGGTRAVCLGNLKTLLMAWTLYAGDNNEKIVCGEVYSGVKGTNGIRKVSDGNEPYWTGDDVTDSSLTKRLSKKKQISAIKSGALFQYIKSEKYYRCNYGKKGEMRTYTIVEAMNGTSRGLEGREVDKIQLYIKNMMQIRSPAERIVFIDVNEATPGSFSIYYDKEQWQDPAPVLHGNGMTLSFADGHVEYWKWTGEETIANGRSAKPTQDLQPTTQAGLEDLHKFQKGVWGRLGYKLSDGN